jgi:hypothetical protein
VKKPAPRDEENKKRETRISENINNEKEKR